MFTTWATATASAPTWPTWPTWPPPSIDYPPIEQPTGAPPLPNDGVFVDQEERPQALRVWGHADAHPGETVPYFANLGNKGNAAYAFALLAFLDFRQVPLDGRDQWVAYGTVPAHGQGVAPGRLIAPAAPGALEFLLLLVRNPYTALEVPPDGPDRQFVRIPHEVEPSIRTAIVVTK